MDIVSARRQDQQGKTIIQCKTIFISKLSTNYNNFYQDSVIQTKTEHYTIPTKHILLILYPSTNTQSGSSENITISTEANIITTSPSPFVSKPDLETSLEEMFDISDEISKKSNQIFE